jgi:signal transduction histidine kinase
MDALTLTLVGVLVGIGALAVIGGIVGAQRSRRQAAQSLSATDFVRNTFPSRLRRREPLDDLLKQMVEALRDTFGLDRSEVWVAGGGQLRLVLSDPPREATSIPLSAAEESVVANAKISGSAWARTWLPALVSADSTASARIVPVAHQGALLGLIVIERAKDAAKLAEQTDDTLGELARELGPAWQNAQLDTALEATLDQLRERAAELQASRARIVEAGDAQRRRIERDPARARMLLNELHDDVQRAIDEVRALAHGIYPPLLSQEGLSRALEAACRRSAISAQVEADGIGRYSPGLEAAVYFSCVEALQNAAKYAGSGARVNVRLREEPETLVFEVVDDGIGFDAATRSLGAGLTNIQDRIGALGGTVRIDSQLGGGTRLTGIVPVVPADEASRP